MNGILYKGEPSTYLRNANAARQAEQGARVILAKLQAGSYKDAAFEEADRRMLAIYLR